MALKDEEKRKAYDKAYRLAHSERTKIVLNKYYRANRKKLLNKSIAYGKAHAEERKIYLKNYRQANSEKRRVYRQTKLEHIRVCEKIYRQKNPEKLRINGRKRRALKHKALHEPYTNSYIFERDGWICQICGQKINRRLKYPSPRSGSIDHIIPLSKGGNDSPMNVQAAHLRCNVGKHATNKGQLRLFG